MAKENFKEVTEEMENKVEEIQETTEVVEVKKENLITRWNNLKFWQKVAVITLLGGSIVGGIMLIRKLIKTNPKAVAEAIDTVVENPEIVQDLTEEMAKVG